MATRAAVAAKLAPAWFAPTRESESAWRNLRPFARQIDASDQVLLIAATGGAKSTLAATETLNVGSLVAIDGKDSLYLPNATVYELPKAPDWPKSSQMNSDPGVGAYDRAIAAALAWRDGRNANRVILRPHVEDIEDFWAFDRMYKAIYTRGHTLVWIDEITSTGATPQRSQPYLRAITARGRTREIGLWTLSQAPFGLVPGILRRNATYTILGPIEPQDEAEIRRVGSEIALTIPPKSGRFIVYPAGDVGMPFRLYVPIPNALIGWRAP
jgi:hypothetical protein